MELKVASFFPVAKCPDLVNKNQWKAGTCISKI